jgi:hypothetical protein
MSGFAAFHLVFIFDCYIFRTASPTNAGHPVGMQMPEHRTPEHRIPAFLSQAEKG